jgi:hypothetical protein
LWFWQEKDEEETVRARGKKEETVWREKEEIQIVAVGQGTTSC